MQAKRTTYAAGPGNNEIWKIALEIKQVIKQFQDDVLKKCPKLLNEYVNYTWS